MTVLTLYRLPRRFVRKLPKPLALAFNARQMKASEIEIDILGAGIELNRELIGMEHRHQVKLQMQRRAVEGW